MNNSRQKAFVVFNSTAGNESQSNEVREALTRHFIRCLEIYETTGEEDIAAIAVRLVIVAPAATSHWPIVTNDLARVLLIPLKIDEAAELLARFSGTL